MIPMKDAHSLSAAGRHYPIYPPPPREYAETAVLVELNINSFCLLLLSLH